MPISKHKYNHQKAFSLVELLVTIGIVMAVIGVITLFQSNIFTYTFSTQNSLSAQFDANKVVKQMVLELRGMSESAAGAYPILAVSTSSITFFADIDKDNAKEKIRYYLSGNTLYRGLVEPTGNPVGYTGAESVSILVSDIVNSTSTPIFSYYGIKYQGDSTPTLTYPISTSEVRMVKIEVWIDRNIHRSPTVIKSTSQVTLRNIEDNL
jgi:type II secretory pathway pseudopilin PulG